MCELLKYIWESLLLKKKIGNTTKKKIQEYLKLLHFYFDFFPPNAIVAPTTSIEAAI